MLHVEEQWTVRKNILFNYLAWEQTFVMRLEKQAQVEF